MHAPRVPRASSVAEVRRSLRREALRYDTTQAFAQKTSWQAFDTLSVVANAAGFFGSPPDGERVYLRNVVLQ